MKQIKQPKTLNLKPGEDRVAHGGFQGGRLYDFFT